MKVFTLLAAIVLTRITALTSAAAINKRQGGDGANCIWQLTKTYAIASTNDYYETPVLITGIEVGPDPAGGAITVSYSYSKSYSVSIDAAGVFDPQKVVDDITGNTGLVGGFSVSFTEGTGVSGTENCPANAICGLTASAHLLDVKGTVLQQLSIETGNGVVYYDPSSTTNLPCNYPSDYNDTPVNTYIPYAATFPIVSPNSLVNGQDEMQTKFTICAVEAFAGLVTCPPGDSNAP